MREIKFRAWDKKEKKMYFFGNWSLDSEYTNFALGFEHINWEQGVVTKEDTKNCILMQYTGLKDKNGKEIYEGDILRNAYGKYIVYWLQYDCQFVMAENIKIVEDAGFNYILSKGNIKEFEIIGNIYENPASASLSPSVSPSVSISLSPSVSASLSTAMKHNPEHYQSIYGAVFVGFVIGFVIGCIFFF